MTKLQAASTYPREGQSYDNYMWKAFTRASSLCAS
jgi:hypothetical protein